MGGVETLLLLCLCRLLPESPCFLATQRRRAPEAAASSRHIATGHETPGVSTYSQGAYSQECSKEAGCIQAEPEHFRDLLSDNVTVLSCGATVKLLWGHALRRTTMLLWVIWFGTSFGCQGFSTLLPEFFKSKNIANTHMHQDVFVYSLAGVLGVVLASLVVERRNGRRAIICMCLGCTSLFIALFAWASSEWSLVSLSCLFNMFSNTAWCAIYTYTPEVYMTEIRSQAVGVAHALHSLAGIIAPSLGGWMVQTHHLDASLLMFASPLVASFAAASLLRLEMTGQELRHLVPETFINEGTVPAAESHAPICAHG